MVRYRRAFPHVHFELQPRQAVPVQPDARPLNLRVDHSKAEVSAGKWYLFCVQLVADLVEGGCTGSTAQTSDVCRIRRLFNLSQPVEHADEGVDAVSAGCRVCQYLNIQVLAEHLDHGQVGIQLIIGVALALSHDYSLDWPASISLVEAVRGYRAVIMKDDSLLAGRDELAEVVDGNIAVQLEYEQVVLGDAQELRTGQEFGDIIEGLEVFAADLCYLQPEFLHEHGSHWQAKILPEDCIECLQHGSEMIHSGWLSVSLYSSNSSQSTPRTRRLAG